MEARSSEMEDGFVAFLVSWLERPLYVARRCVRAEHTAPLRSRSDYRSLPRVLPPGGGNLSLMKWLGAPSGAPKLQTKKRSSNHEHETRSGNHPCFRRRSSQSVLRKTRLAIGRQFHH